MKIKVFVPARDSQGAPTLLAVDVICLEVEYTDGLHYGKAVALAEDGGYETGKDPICFDANDVGDRLDYFEKAAYPLE